MNMNQKTIHLSNDYRLNGNTVEVFSYLGTKNPVDYSDNAPEPEYVYDWVPSPYKIGERVMLVSHTNVSPNAIRAGKNIDAYSLIFNAPDGIAGNLNRNITRFHGWRGTTQDVSCYAHGLREIIKIRELKNGRVAVTVGADLKPDED
jgi:hypothetical protein